MKKYIKTILMAIIFILFATLTVYASGEIVKMETSTKENVKAGDIITVTVSAENSTGIEGFDSTLEYDKTKLELINEEEIAATDYINVSGIDEETEAFKLSVLYVGEGNGPTQSNFATLQFKVLDGAKDNLKIKLSKIQIIDSKNKGIQVKDQEITINEENKYIKIGFYAFVGIIGVGIITRVVHKKSNKSKAKR